MPPKLEKKNSQSGFPKKKKAECYDCSKTVICQNINGGWFCKDCAQAYGRVVGVAALLGLVGAVAREAEKEYKSK